MKEAFVIVGPIASGKTHLGKIIEREYGIPFLSYEEIFIQEQKRNPEGFLKRAEPMAERAIFELLATERKICFENTMSRPYALEILNKLQQMADVRMIFVRAPFALASKRLEQRNQSAQVKWSYAEIKDIYEKSAHLGLDYDLVIHNADLSDDDLLCALRPLLEERVWHQEYAKILFRGKRLLFSSWNTVNLTAYDMEYKPWRASFKKENPGYLYHYDLKPGDVVIDAGGYEGTFAVYAAMVIGNTGKVIVFEPDTENFRKLQENVALNKLDNTIILNKALWREDTRLKFNDKHTAGASFFFNASPHMREIDAVSLDNELRRLGVTKIDFIKMDVEGSEVQALEGATGTLRANNAHMAIASYHIINGQQTSPLVEAILGRLGYRAVTEFAQHTTTYGSRTGGIPVVDNDAAKRPDTIPIETIRQEHAHEFIENGKRIGENGLAVGSGGNLSIKVPGGILITSSGSTLSDLKPDEIVFVPYADGDAVYFTGSKKPSSETINHWIIYQERPDVKAISHVNVGPKESKHITTAKRV